MGMTYQRPREEHVSATMATRLLTIGPGETLQEAAHRMADRRVGAILVTEGEALVGILTERDVLRAAASGSDLTKSPASEWMTRSPITATPDTTIGEAADVMLANGFRHLPVVEGRELKGVVSIRDVLASGIRPPNSK